MRLSAPTNKTFFPALVLIVLGVLLWVTAVGDGEVAFWLVTGGGGLLVLGSVFNRI
jgi:hypothetical protein